MKLPWWLPFGTVPEITAVDLQARLQSQRAPQIADVRTLLEWRKSRIPGAISTPITDLNNTLATRPLDRNRPVVAVCLSAHRSIPAVRFLRAQGFEAYQLQHGMRAWWKAKLPVEASTD